MHTDVERESSGESYRLMVLDFTPVFGLQFSSKGERS